jgi:Vitamin K-dependent gamma-carboxylase
VKNLLQRADAWVFAPEDPRRLAAVRIGLCVLLARRMALSGYGVAARHPALFQPHFYMTVFPRMPSPAVVMALQICGIVAALVAAAGLALRASLPLAFGCSLVLHGVLNSIGRTIVGDALLMLCVLVLLVSGRAAGEAWSLRRAQAPSRSARYGWPIRTMMIAIALAYFFAALQKWRYSGLPWVTSDNLRWILAGQAHPNDLALFIADRPWLSHLFAAGALLLETCFPLVLFFPRLRWLFVPGAVAMHVGIRLAMGLDYSAQWLTVVIVFVNWPVVVAFARRAATPVFAPRQVPG